MNDRPIFDRPLTDDERVNMTISYLKSDCHDCPLYMKNNGSGIGCDELFDGKELCSEIRATALKLDDERNRKMDDTLPTESELRDELDALCKVVRKQFYDGELVLVGDERAGYKPGTMRLVIEKPPSDVLMGWKITGRPHQFRPDLKAPADNAGVFVGTPGYRRLSTGRINSDGHLMCYNDNPTYGPVPWGQWCSINDRSHHSHNWRREWEPDYKNGDES